MPERERNIYYKGKIESRSQSGSYLMNPGDFVIVERGSPRLLILRCPCGCGDDLLINLDSRSGPAWRFYEKSNTFSLFPSYWKDTSCGSHFIIWNNKIYWCSRYDQDDSEWKVSKKVENKVLKFLNEDQFRHYTDIADECALVPWECLQACKQLVVKGLCVASQSKRDEFRKISPGNKIDSTRNSNDIKAHKDFKKKYRSIFKK